jgi:hypothetical protein
VAHKEWLVVLGVMVAASPASASRPVLTTAPAGTPQTRYCMRVEPVTGTRIETVECWTRDQWADQGVDVDRDWPKEGVAVIG